MCSPLHDFSNSDSIHALIRCHCPRCSSATLNISVLAHCLHLGLDTFLVYDAHLFVVELNQVVDDQVIAVVEDLGGGYYSSDSVIKDVGILRSEVVKHVGGRCLL